MREPGESTVCRCDSCIDGRIKRKALEDAAPDLLRACQYIQKHGMNATVNLGAKVGDMDAIVNDPEEMLRKAIQKATP